jgi:hypothetical protein
MIDAFYRPVSRPWPYISMANRLKDNPTTYRHCHFLRTICTISYKNSQKGGYQQLNKGGNNETGVPYFNRNGCPRPARFPGHGRGKSALETGHVLVVNPHPVRNGTD